MGGGGKSKKGGGGGGGGAAKQHQQPPQAGGGGKAARKAEAAEFDALLKEVRQTTASTMRLGAAQVLNLLVAAFAMTGMPQVFFHSPVFYDVDIPAYKAQFIGVTVVSALALTYAYVLVGSTHEAKLLATREVEGKRGGKEGRAAAEAAMAGSTNLESLSYALFVVNALYLGLFLLLAFKACESAGVSAPNTQLLSTFLPAVVIVSMAPKLA